VTISGSSEELSLPNHIDDVVFKLGRMCVALDEMVDDISGLTKWTYAKNTPIEIKDEYLEICSAETKGRSPRIKDLIAEAKRLSELPENIDVKGKLEFYSLLGDIRLQIAQFITGLVDSGVKMDLVSGTAVALGEINKTNINNLPEILHNIGIVHGPSEAYSPHDKKEALNVAVSLMGFVDSKPAWVGVIEKELVLE
jgi:hypothetical protein